MLIMHARIHSFHKYLLCTFNYVPGIDLDTEVGK